MLLEVKAVSASYGPVRALRDVSVSIEAGEIVTLLGANGAGKTTLLRVISRLLPLDSGKLTFAGQNLARIAPAAIVRAGLAHCPEGRRIFPELTVGENLALGAYVLNDQRRVRENREKGFFYFPVLREREKQKAGTLSGGEQQMLAVARALMSSPRLLMLDEPSLGLAPLVIDQLFEILCRLRREENVTIFLVEQNANEALLHADRAYVLENGVITLEGSAADLRRDPRVREAYLGVEKAP